ncbi:MAG: RNA methyltransferase [Polyangiaceae bacterium]
MTEAEGRLVLGLQPVREALRVHGEQIRRVWLDARDEPRLLALARFATDRGAAEVERVPRARLDKLSRGTEHQGVAAWAPPLVLLPPKTLLEDPALLAVALDGIQDPQNFGAIIRSAVGVADAAVIWPEHGSAPLSPATFRASAGAIEHARLCRVHSLHGFIDEAVARGVTVIGLDANADATLAEHSLQRPTVLVVGSEHRGLARNVRRSIPTLARLLAPHHIDSLNASVAAAIALYVASNSPTLSST